MSDSPSINPLTRPLEVSDLDAIAAIHWESARVAYAYRGWRYSVTDVSAWYRDKLPEWDWGQIALASGPADAGLPIGFVASIGPFLDQLFVLPAYQRGGIGLRLLTAMLERGLRPVRLHVLQGNTLARAFYDRHGFVLERSWWDTDEDETVMQYRLD